MTKFVEAIDNEVYFERFLPDEEDDGDDDDEMPNLPLPRLLNHGELTSYGTLVVSGFSRYFPALSVVTSPPFHSGRTSFFLMSKSASPFRRP